MKKLILATLAIVCISSMSFATEVEMTTNNSHDYDLAIYKTSPFCMAIVKGDIETVKKLIDLGSDVNQKSDGMTPLMYAARYNRTEIMKMLIEKGANIKTKDSKGYTAMKFAKLSNAKDAVALLEELS
ncbi:ankyrin repeat domain-containing protein [Aquimarina sediminis]|uniref:ankyrin repeat domain-containing protein n=1 Tax=Aquimarina sediminis TaxID=2070536 RepID=UPI000CA0403E|nr:ankyrin repeat domain-containing protein [Aquimarina sediminis]